MFSCIQLLYTVFIENSNKYSNYSLLISYLFIVYIFTICFNCMLLVNFVRTIKLIVYNYIY